MKEGVYFIDSNGAAAGIGDSVRVGSFWYGRLVAIGVSDGGCRELIVDIDSREGEFEGGLHRCRPEDVSSTGDFRDVPLYKDD